MNKHLSPHTPNPDAQNPDAQNSDLLKKNTRFELRIEIETKDIIEGSELNALNLLSAKTSLSKQKIKLACQQGAVCLSKQKVTSRLRNATKILKVGDVIELFYDERLLTRTLIKPTLIADEDDYSLWFKPQGLLAQGTQWGDFHSLLRFIEFNLLPQRPAFLVHRLDKDASGIMMIAHNKEVAAKFSKKFSARDISKQYHAIVEGHFPKDKITLDKHIDGKEALSIALGLAYDESKNISLVWVDLKTGRKHQIRQHLANFGFPIIGDKLYGNPKTKQKLQLCAIRLAFNYPNRLSFREYQLDSQLMLPFP